MRIRIAKICDAASSSRVIFLLSKVFVNAGLSLSLRRTSVYVANTIACVLRIVLLMVGIALRLSISLPILH